MYRFTRNSAFLEIGGVRYVYKRDRDEFEEDDTETIFDGSSDSVIFVGEMMNTSSDSMIWVATETKEENVEEIDALCDGIGAMALQPQMEPKSKYRII